MIQRIQTLWLLIASAAAFFILKFPFYYTPQPNALEINGAAQYSTLIGLAFSACLSFFTSVDWDSLFSELFPQLDKINEANKYIASSFDRPSA